MSEEKTSYPNLAQEVQINEREAKIEESGIPILTLSPSRIKTYQQCPRKYYHTYVTKLPRKDWAHFHLGTMVHGVLEFFHAEFKKDGCELNLKHLMKEAFQKQRETWKKENIDKDLSMEILTQARDLLFEYLKRMETSGIGSEIISLEEDFRIGLGMMCYEPESKLWRILQDGEMPADNMKTCKVDIRGIVDRIDRDSDGVMHIRDYKTTKNKKYMEPSQLQSYGIHLLEKYPNIDRFRGSYIMLRHGGEPISYDFNLEDIKKERLIILDYAIKITQEERWIMKQSILCDWCDFKDPCLMTW